MRGEGLSVSVINLDSVMGWKLGSGFHDCSEWDQTGVDDLSAWEWFVMCLEGLHGRFDFENVVFKGLENLSSRH